MTAPSSPQLFSRKEMLAHKLMQTQQDLKTANERIAALESELSELRTQANTRKEQGLRLAFDGAGPFTARENTLDDLRLAMDRLSDRLRNQDVMLSQIWNRLDGGAA